MVVVVEEFNGCGDVDDALLEGVVVLDGGVDGDGVGEFVVGCFVVV